MQPVLLRTDRPVPGAWVLQNSSVSKVLRTKPSRGLSGTWGLGAATAMVASASAKIDWMRMVAVETAELVG